MIVDLRHMAICVKPAIDMRKQINGLAMLVTEAMGKDPLSGGQFLFCNRERRILKALYWERNGFCLWQKRLERNRFPWPASEGAARAISYEQLSMLLDGIDFWKAHTRLAY